MTLDFLGAEQHFSMLCGSAPTYRLDFIASSGEAIVLDNVTFDGVLTSSDGTVYRLDVSQGTEVGALFVVLPAVEVGNYDYELRATSEAGERMRVAYGRVGVLPTGLDLSRIESDTEVRRLAVRLPDAAANHCMLEWRAATDAGRAATEAQQAATEAQQAVAEAQQAVTDAEEVAVRSREELTEVAEMVSDELAKIVERVSDEMAEIVEHVDEVAEQAAAAAAIAEDATHKLESLDELLDRFREELARQISIDPTTNTWVVGGVDQGVKATGAPGKSPKLTVHLTWMVYDDEAGEWVDTGLSAVGQDGKSPYISALGTWVEWLNGEWVDTGRKVEGRDGRDGEAIRRILIPSASDLPTEGGTCNGGVYYYVPLIDSEPRAEILIIDGERTTQDVMRVDGVEITISPTMTAAAIAAAINDASLPGVRAESGHEDMVSLYSINDTLTVTRDNAAAYEVREYPMIDREGYLVYAWLEDAEGARWYKVGEANDLATSEIYGLAKLATDSPVVGGAPVGNDEHGALHVPRADYTTPGAVRPAVDDAVEIGGAVGLTTSGRMMAETGTAARFGTIRHSHPEEAGAGCIGLMPDGSTGARWATLYEPGVAYLGSEFGQLNRIPYQQGVGATNEHKLANNLLYTGALQHKKKASWVTDGMDWLNNAPASIYFNDNDFYCGLKTSVQFTQSEAAGLELLAATTSRLAGCYLARSIDSDKRAAAVPTASTTLNYLNDNYYRKEEVYTQAETHVYVEGYVQDYVGETLKPYAKQSWVQAEMQDYVGETLKPYAKQSWVQAEMREYVGATLKPYAKESWVEAKNYDTVESVDRKLTGYIPIQPGVLLKIQLLTRQEYMDLQTRDKNTLYIQCSAAALANLQA